MVDGSIGEKKNDSDAPLTSFDFVWFLLLMLIDRYAFLVISTVVMRETRALFLDQEERRANFSRAGGEFRKRRVETRREWTFGCRKDREEKMRSIWKLFEQVRGRVLLGSPCEVFLSP